MLEWIHTTTTALGYPGIALLMFVENVFPPLPSELVMPLAGFSAAQGHLSFAGVVLAGSVGSLLGQLPYYLLGRWVGGEQLVRWFDRYGKLVALSGSDLRRAEGWFERYGSRAVFFGRLVPGLRSLIPVPAGLNEMPLPKFLLYSAFGTVLWTLLLALLGFVLRQNYHRVGQYLGHATLIVLALALAAALGWSVQRVVARCRS